MIETNDLSTVRLSDFKLWRLATRLKIVTHKLHHNIELGFCRIKVCRETKLTMHAVAKSENLPD